MESQASQFETNYSTVAASLQNMVLNFSNDANRQLAAFKEQIEVLKKENKRLVDKYEPPKALPPPEEVIPKTK